MQHKYSTTQQHKYGAASRAEPGMSWFGGDLLCIEDPYEDNFNLRRRIDAEKFAFVKKALQAEREKYRIFRSTMPAQQTLKRLSMELGSKGPTRNVASEGHYNVTFSTQGQTVIMTIPTRGATLQKNYMGKVVLNFGSCAKISVFFSYSILRLL